MKLGLPSRLRAKSTAARPAGKARPLRMAKQSATTEPELEESLDRAAATAAVKDRENSVTSESESELAESFDEESSPHERVQPWTAQQWAEWRREFEAACHRWRKERLDMLCQEVHEA